MKVLKVHIYEGKELDFQAQRVFCCNLVLQNELLNRLMNHTIHHGKKQMSFAKKSLEHN